MQYLLSLIFIAQMYVVMLIMAIGFLPFVLIDRRYAYKAVNTYCKWVRWTARVIIGLKSEVRGEVPTDEVIVASKHQSFFDIILLVSVLPRPKFIMKASLRYAPIVGFYANRIGCVPVNRGKRAEAIRKMMAGVTAGNALPGQLVIFPQGTRVAPFAYLPYKVGTYVIYEATGQACVPAATNVGVFWPRHGILRKPGLAVVEFLKPIEPGLDKETFMKQLEADVEVASDQLMTDGAVTRS